MDTASIITTVSIAAVVAATAYSAVKQRRPHTVAFGVARFKKAAVLVGAGVVFGAFDPPTNRVALVSFAISLAMSVVVGWLRGRWSLLWRAAGASTVLHRGTTLTIGLFIGLVLAKRALAGYGQSHGVNDHGAFGEILLMIVVMAAVYAEVVARRGEALPPGPDCAADQPGRSISPGTPSAANG